MTTTLKLKTISNCFIALSLLLTALCIFQIGFFTRERYLITKYENEIFTLSEHNRALAVNFSKVTSLANINNHLSSKNFTVPQDIEYIEVLDTSVAANQ